MNTILYMYMYFGVANLYIADAVGGESSGLSGRWPRIATESRCFGRWRPYMRAIRFRFRSLWLLLELLLFSNVPFVVARLKFTIFMKRKDWASKLKYFLKYIERYYHEKHPAIEEQLEESPDADEDTERIEIWMRQNAALKNTSQTSQFEK